MQVEKHPTGIVNGWQTHFVTPNGMYAVFPSFAVRVGHEKAEET